MQRNQLRIIGGFHRSRKLHFPDVEGLRPTGDRIRETLFNWLAPVIDGSRCLDLFAGSGALGLEALSRGAGEVIFVDRSQTACDYLQQNIDLLTLSGATVYCTDSVRALSQQQTPFDVVFLDPPFSSIELLNESGKVLEASNLLKSGSMIYVEQDSKTTGFHPPGNWELYRDKCSGQVRYQLYRRH